MTWKKWAWIPIIIRCSRCWATGVLVTISKRGHCLELGTADRVYQLDKSRLYVTIFEEATKRGLPAMKKPGRNGKMDSGRPDPPRQKKRIISGRWAKQVVGPAEIHFDTRPEANNDGHQLVNNDDTGMVMEIWNNVFIQFNRLKTEAWSRSLRGTSIPVWVWRDWFGYLQGKRVTTIQTYSPVRSLPLKKKITGRNMITAIAKQPLLSGCWPITCARLASPSLMVSCLQYRGRLCNPAHPAPGGRVLLFYLDFRQPLLNQLVPVLATSLSRSFQNFTSRPILLPGW